MSKATFQIVCNRTKRLDKNGKANLEIRVTINRTPYYFNTGRKINPNDWNKKKKEVKKEEPLFAEINNYLKSLIVKMERLEIQFRNEGKLIGYHDFKELLTLQQSVKKISFSEFFKSQIEPRKEIGKCRKTHLNTTLNYLHQIKKPIEFKDLTFDFLKKFEGLMIDKGLCEATQEGHHKRLISIINIAIKKELLEKNIYKTSDFRIPKSPTRKVALNSDELERIENLTFPADLKHLETIRDIFLFSCYTSFRWTDSQKLNREWLTFGNEGEIWLNFTPSKKGSRDVKDVPLHKLFKGKAKQLIDKYLKPENQYVFPRMTNPYFNRAFKEVAKMAKVTKPKLCHHIARHTFCNNMLNYKGLTHKQVMSMTGHAQETTLFGYTTDSPELRNKALDKIEW